MTFDGNRFITSDGFNLLNEFVNPVARYTVTPKYNAAYGGTNWSEVNAFTYNGQMPTDYGTIMNNNAPVFSFGGGSSVSSSLSAAGFSLLGSHIDNSVMLKYQQEMAEKAKEDTEKNKKSGTGSYTYEINDKGEITYKKPDGKNCTVIEFKKMAGEVAFKKAQEEAKSKKEKA